MISVCFLFFKIPLPRGGSYLSIVIPTGAKHRIQSPLERWPRTISTDRPEMESRPYEFLLHPYSTNKWDREVFVFDNLLISPLMSSLIRAAACLIASDCQIALASE